MSISKPVPEMSSDDVARFRKKVKLGDESQCWPWTAGLFDHGYGAFRIRIATNVYRQVIATRIAYKLGHGVDPAGMFVCHSCDNPLCCNPKHLFLGTPTMNEQDKIAKGRRPSLFGEKSGVARLTEKTVVIARQMFASGKSQKAIANHLGVNQSTISLAVRGKTWSHIQCA